MDYLCFFLKIQQLEKKHAVTATEVFALVIYQHLIHGNYLPVFEPLFI